jgi:hypothetical protein
MDVRVPDLQEQPDGDESGIRPRSDAQPVAALAAREKEFFNLAPVHEVETRYVALQNLLHDLAVIARQRRAAKEAERCAICGGPWKKKLPDGGRVPMGTEFWEDPKTHTTIALYACDAACYSRLQWETKKNSFQLLKDRDEQRMREHQRVVELRGSQPLPKL